MLEEGGWVFQSPACGGFHLALRTQKYSRAPQLLGAQGLLRSVSGRDRPQMTSAVYGKSNTHHCVLFSGSLSDIHQESKNVAFMATSGSIIP